MARYGIDNYDNQGKQIAQKVGTDIFCVAENVHSYEIKGCNEPYPGDQKFDTHDRKFTRNAGKGHPNQISI
jgi:hypothetical protein